MATSGRGGPCAIDAEADSDRNRTAVRVGVTGSEGFLGSAVVAAFEAAGHEARKLDIRLPAGAPGSGSILDPDTTRRFAEGCDGVIHLAAVSRVIHGEADPGACE